MICRDVPKSLMNTKLKFPFPHMVSVLMRDISSGKLELMSQGTGDIILESCTDYWDGSNIAPLTEKERKKILDFYHRTSLSSYCTSFSYRPTACKIKDELSRFYLELPLDPSHLYQAAATPTPHISTEALFGDVEHSEYEEISDAEDSLRLQSKQIFIGMVCMQYQAKMDMVRMIEQLDDACIRFIHFSKENELRSRVFSEKMGLESGWNCHISLLSDKNRADSSISGRASNSVLSKSPGYALSDPHFGDLLHQNKLKGFFESSRNLSYSAPSAINLETNQVKFDEEVSVWSGSKINQFFDGDSHEDHDRDWNIGHTSNECLLIDGENEDALVNCHSQKFTVGPHSHTTSQSLSVSNISSSSDDNTASLNLIDLSNRANLPKGIENIRPHLKYVDNVPLLVSLFTDCTTPNTGTMLQIMQENGEVTMLMGSTSSAENMDLFMQADLCLGVEPLYPQVCMQEPVFTLPKSVETYSPTEVARKLNSIPCSLSFHRDDTISIIHLILESRHYMQCFMNCFQFWAGCSISVSTIQLFSSCSLLPPILSLLDVLWLVLIPIPLLSVSLQFSPLNNNVMNEPTGKNKVQVNRQTIRYVLCYYASKFLPSLLVVFLVYFLLVNNVCSMFQEHFSCDYIYPSFSSNFSSSYQEDLRKNIKSSIFLTQKLAGFQLVLYFCFISVSFVHKMYPLREKGPHSNKYWIISFFLAILCQSFYTIFCVLTVEKGSFFGSLVSSIPKWILCIYILWPFLILIINELIKKNEIRVNVRYQKRARLEFGTKLGMNSPF